MVAGVRSWFMEFGASRWLTDIEGISLELRWWQV